MTILPIIHAGTVTCHKCGGFWHEHRSNPQHTEPEWCEHLGYASDAHTLDPSFKNAFGRVRCMCGKTFSLAIPYDDDENTEFDLHTMQFEYPLCHCNEFEPVEYDAFEAFWLVVRARA